DDYNNGSHSFVSSKAIMEDELANGCRRSCLILPQTDNKPGPLSQTSSSIQYSQEEIDK
ncbi:15165_t:CDS:1, partial [Dentiscutata heterogama]